MALLQGPVAKGSQAVAYPSSAGETVTNRFEVTVPATGAGSAVGDIIEIGSLPPNCRVVEMAIDNDAVVGATFGCDVGLMSGEPGALFNSDGVTPRTCGAEYFSAQALSVVAAPGTLVSQMTLSSGFRVTPTGKERSIGMKITTRTTPAAGKVALIVQFASG